MWLLVIVIYVSIWHACRIRPVSSSYIRIALRIELYPIRMSPWQDIMAGEIGGYRAKVINLVYLCCRFSGVWT